MNAEQILSCLRDGLITPGECRRLLIETGLTYDQARTLTLKEWVRDPFDFLDECDPA